MPGTPNDVGITGTLPEDFPQSIVELTERVTARAETPIRKAAAIQAFLRDPRQFTYSTEPLPGTGYRALENFLLQDQRGYCEQFAAAMAAMARALRIPSRVAVGFLPGERRGETWEVSIRDMHAWPELYFAGYGWVRFEPTPSSVTGTAPSWTVPGADEPTDTPSDTPSDLPSAANPNDPEAPSTAPTQQPTDIPVDAGFDWVRTLLFAALGLLVLAILAAPATIRVRRRNTRLTAEGGTAEQVESAWAEIRDTVVDHGGSWPGGSPRAIGTHVAERTGAARVGQHGSDSHAGGTLPVRPLGRARRRRRRPADDDHRHPPRHRRPAVEAAPPAGRRLPALGVPAAVLAFDLPRARLSLEARPCSPRPTPRTGARAVGDPRPPDLRWSGYR